MKGKTLLRNLGKIAKEEGFEDEVLVIVGNKKGGIEARRYFPKDAEKNEYLAKIWNGVWDH